MSKELTDEQYLQLYLDTGKDEYMSQLYVRYVDMIYGVCLKYYRNATDAKDACSEIYELLLRRAKGKQIDNWRPWLYTVVKNYCLEQLRARGNKLPKQMQADLVYSEEVFHPNSEDQEQELNKLNKCIDGLPAEQKQCVQMFYLEKKSYKELSSLLNISWSTIRSRIQNGRRNLKICMQSK